MQGWFTRERLSTLTLLAATAVSVYLCYLLAKPFLPALGWALALAVVAHPMHRRLARSLRPGMAAGVSTAVVAVVLAVPAGLVGYQIAGEAARAAQLLEKEVKSGELREKLRSNRHLRPVVDFIERRVDMEEQFTRLSSAMGGVGKAVLGGLLSTGVQFVVALFVLFFLFRDRKPAIARVRMLLPLNDAETDSMLRRIRDTIDAAVFGHVAVALVQGVLGGIVFALLGLPAAVLWGFVMFIMAVIPMLGAVAVWAPAAVYLAATGSWGKAIFLAIFGTLVISLIDNLLYPVLVGRKLRLHTLPVFLSIIGGLVLFGASGLVLGPVVLAVTSALIDVWCSRTSAGKPAEAGVSPSSSPAERPRPELPDAPADAA